MSKYTIYIVTRNADHHYPVIMANNGKAILNEPVKRAHKLERSITNLYCEFNDMTVRVERITEKAFKAKFPQFARNAGKKRVRVTKAIANPVKP